MEITGWQTGGAGKYEFLYARRLFGRVNRGYPEASVIASIDC